MVPADLECDLKRGNFGPWVDAHDAPFCAGLTHKDATGAIVWAGGGVCSVVSATAGLFPKRTTWKGCDSCFRNCWSETSLFVNSLEDQSLHRKQ